MTALNIVENNGLTVIENFPTPPIQSQGPNDIAYVGVAPTRDSSIPLNQVIELNDETIAKLDPNNNGASTVKAFAVQALKHSPGRLYAILVEDNEDNAILKANILGTVSGRQRTGLQLLEASEIEPTLISSDLSHDVDVALALGTTAKKLNAIGVVSGPSTTSEAAIAFRESLIAEVGDHILIIEGMGRVVVGDEPLYLPSPIIALGALASRPLNRSPHGTPLLISGIDTTIDFNFIDANSEGNRLNSNRINFIKLIKNNGYQNIGHHTAGGKFYSHVGLAIIVKRLVVRFFTTRIGPNLTDDYVTSLIDEFNQQLYNLQARGLLAQGEISLNRNLNTVSENGQGTLYLVIDVERFSPAVHYVVQINYRNRQVSIA